MNLVVDSFLPVIFNTCALHCMQSPVYRFLDAVPTFADKAEAAPACANWEDSAALRPAKNEGFAVPTQVGRDGVGGKGW